MGTISTGIGLISGIDYTKLVGQLIAIEKRPGQVIQNQIDQNTAVRNALQAVSLSLVSAKLAVSRLSSSGAFASRTATSSSDAIGASAGAKATVGAFQFTPKQQVSTQQLLSNGFASQSSLLGNSSTTSLTISRGGFVNESTKLATLNGGNGVAAGSIRIINGSSSASVDLSGATTVDDVVSAINSTSGLGVTARLDGNRFTLESAGGNAITVEEIGGGATASDLGLRNLVLNGGVNQGEQILKLGNSSSLQSLNDGNGVRQTAGIADFQIVLDGSSTFDINIDGAKNVGDVLAAISDQTGGAVTASVVDGSIQLAGGSSDIAVNAIGGSNTAFDLGILGGGSGTTLTGRNIVGGFNTVLLASLKGGYNGGADDLVQAGTIDINGTAINLSSASTLQDVIAGINAESGTTGVTASVNQARNGLTLTRAGGGSITVTDTTGNLGGFLNVAGNSNSGALKSGDLERKYISEGTRLDSLNGGQGISRGKFKIVDGFGNTGTVDLTQESDVTLGDVILEINTRPGLQVSARINDTGDGILIEKLGGTGDVQVFEEGSGKTASSLNLLAGSDGSGNVNGSLKKSITVEATDTLSSLIEKINAAGAGVSAGILNTGLGENPFRLNLTSQQSGSAGALLIDVGDTNLAFNITTQAKDAVLLYGSGPNAVQLTSGKNQFVDVVPGLTINVKGTSSAAATVTVAEDANDVVSALKSFVDSINSARKYISDNTAFNVDTSARGVLFTESSVRLADARIGAFINQALRDTGSSLTSLGQLGVRFDGNSGQYTFDQAKFREQYDANRADVERFFADSNNGFVKKFGDLVDGLTSITGVFTERMENLQTSIARQQTSLEQFNVRMDLKQNRLFKEFYNMEISLANLQSQQNTLSQLANLAAASSILGLR